jgi:ubiquinone/menaquinone biosynthesis C-methylase UbiE
MPQPQPQNVSRLSRILTGLMRLFFRLLYHSFSWSYDIVASGVSLGRWKQWVLATAALLAGRRVLELGFGPGHLMNHLYETGYMVTGLDESFQMARQAHRRILRRGFRPRLGRGLAQSLPFASQSFDSVVATFPTLYIVDPATLAEIRRVLTPGGRLVVLMAAWITGKTLRERALQGLFRATAQVPPDDQPLTDFIIPYQEAGFQASIRFVEPAGSRLMFIIAKKGE